MRNFRRNTSAAKGRSTRLIALLAILALSAAACGDTDPASEEGTGVPTLEDEAGGGTPAEEEGESTEDVAAQEDAAFEEWTACMDENGVDVSDLFDEDAGSESEVAAIVEADPDYPAANAACQSILDDQFGSFENDPANQAEMADQSAQVAECGRGVLGVDIPDDILLLPDGDPQLVALEELETTPEQDEALEACFEEILGVEGQGISGG